MELLSGIQPEILNIRMFIMFKYIDPVKVNNFVSRGTASLFPFSLTYGKINPILLRTYRRNFP